jgi:hypothetical protein
MYEFLTIEIAIGGLEIKIVLFKSVDKSFDGLVGEWVREKKKEGERERERERERELRT